MKEFRKNKQGLFICEECNHLFIYKKTLSYHINRFHILKEYYDKWIKEGREGICKICKSQTEYRGKLSSIGYKNCCSKKCENKYQQEQVKLGNLKKYKVEFPLQSEKIREICKQTCLENHGVENPWKSEKIRENGKQTCLKNYGNKNYNNSKKNRETSFKHYGVENSAQNRDIFDKTQKSALRVKKFNNSSLWYQGSFELDFLNNFYASFEIQRGPTIKYIFNDKNKVYFPDFYIPKLNLIIEIKNSYLMKRDKDSINSKMNECLNRGYKYILIIDKNYTQFKEKYLKE